MITVYFRDIPAGVADVVLAALMADIAFASERIDWDFPESGGPRSMIPWRTRCVS